MGGKVPAADFPTIPLDPGFLSQSCALRVHPILCHCCFFIQKAMLARKPDPLPPVLDPFDSLVEINAFPDGTAQEYRLHIHKIRRTELFEEIT